MEFFGNFFILFYFILFYFFFLSFSTTCLYLLLCGLSTAYAESACMELIFLVMWPIMQNNFFKVSQGDMFHYIV